MPKNRFTILGSGTSTGVPTIGCECPVCLSVDPRDKRLRCSLLIESEKTNVVIDTSSDFRQQMLNYNVKKLDGVVFTHHHFDHIGGFDDIRAFNFVMDKPLPIYATENTLCHLQRIYQYAFSPPEQLGGGVPMIYIFEISGNSFNIGDINFIPISMFHGNLEVLGFRIGDFAYCTDTNYIPPESLEQLKGLKVLVIDGLRFTPHPTHFSVNEALDIIDILKPEKAYLTHISHHILHQDTENNLPENVFIAYDGTKFEL
ncbi:MAG: MBL fold metallo-hydrolase [Candidatus Kapabacteria bacterium]|nr:MBL fold metallo-hydrolase [Ignavibacteriota bacterium]MCW5884492.1 MBL fold metallo-hydrolase [Candidatus Kapabacteria bacterium]